MRRLGGLDSAFIEAETAAVHLHVVGVLLLDPTSAPSGWSPEAVLDLVRARLPLLPPFRWRLVRPAGGIARAHWIEDPDFDVEDHLHRVTFDPPADRATLEAFVGEVAATPLDRARPLWDLHVVDGLADGSIAVVTKLHHAFMDGGAGSAVMASLFDLEPGTTAPPPDDGWEPDVAPRPVDLVAAGIRTVVDRAARLPGTVVRTVGSTPAFVGAMLPAGRGSRLPFAPRASFNGPITAARSVSLSTCSLDEVRHVRSAFGCTVNDVVLALVTAAVRAHLEAEGDVPDRPLVAAVPVSVRDAAGDGEFDNRTSIVMIPLPTHLADPLERLTEVAERARESKDRHGQLDPNLVEDLATLVPPWLMATGADLWARSRLGSVAPPLFNLIVSNVPGPPIPLYLAGATVRATFPLGPIFDGGGLNITVLSQSDDLHIGIIACPDLVPDPSALADSMIRELDDLVSVTAKRAR